MKVILKHAGRWLHFQRPKRVLRAERTEEVLPMLREAEASGLFAAGFISYEAAAAFDSALKTHPADEFPLLCMGLFRAPEVLEEIEEEPGVQYEVGTLKPSVSKTDFVEAIGQIREYIAVGATYQVNYTYRLNAPFTGDAWAFFRALVWGQRADYAAFVDTGDFAICSASPELFFSLKGDQVLARPMKGTARRGRTFSEDWKQAEALRASEKDRAENIMIVDMIRNDIGRVAQPGSVETLSQYDLEKYPTLWQMTSTVQGQLKAQNHEGWVDVMESLFPCASITGAPKAKTMEIIRELETGPRKIYTGTVGFITPPGEAFFNVAIRTALIDRQSEQLEFGVGGGIVWDSNAKAEYEETLTKARVLTQPRPEFQLLETLLWEPEKGLFLLEEHLQRLTQSAAYFDVPLEIHTIQHELEQDFGSEPLKIRLLVSRDGTFGLQTLPQQSDPNGATTIALAKSPVDSENIFLFHKTTHRAAYDRARAEFPKCDDVILWNERDEVTEGSIANVVIRKNGCLITPPVECGLLAGTFRAALLKAGEIEEAVVWVNDLRNADEIFLINSVRKWQRAVLQ